MKKITLLITCKDKPGIIAGVTDFIAYNHGNITYVDQHVDIEQDIFFMRVECVFENLQLEKFKLNFKNKLSKIFDFKWHVYLEDEDLPNMALFVSKYDHCLYDLLGRYKSGELKVNIPFIISNHDTLKPIADSFEIPFYHIPITKTTKASAEAKQIKLLQKHRIDIIVLARYMQIITRTLIEKYPNKIINIHHSFLPAFVGAKPYHSAFKRGVKIVP